MLVRRGPADRGRPGARHRGRGARRSAGWARCWPSSGLLDTDGLEDAIALPRARDAGAAVRLAGGRLRASRTSPRSRSAGEVTLKLSTGELILEAVRAVRDPDVVRYALGDIDRVLALSSDPLLRFQKLTLSPADGFVLSRIDGVASAREILQMIPLPAEETQRSLFGLLSHRRRSSSCRWPRRKRDAAAPARRAPAPAPTARPTRRRRRRQPPPRPRRRRRLRLGAATARSRPAPPAPEPAAAPPPARPEGRGAAARDPWRPGRASRRATTSRCSASRARSNEAEVKEAYFRLAKRFHPDVHHDASLGDLRDKLEAVFIRLGEAYDVLRDPKRRGELRGAARPLQAARGPAPAAAAGRGRAGGAGAARRRRATPRKRRASPRRRCARRRSCWSRQDLEQEKPNEPSTSGSPTTRSSCSSRSWTSVQGKSRLRAQLLLARGYSKNPKWAKRAEELLLDASRERPAGRRSPWALLGSIYAARRAAHAGGLHVQEGARAEAGPRGGVRATSRRTPRPTPSHPRTRAAEGAACSAACSGSDDATASPACAGDRARHGARASAPTWWC